MKQPIFLPLLDPWNDATGEGAGIAKWNEPPEASKISGKSFWYKKH